MERTRRYTPPTNEEAIELQKDAINGSEEALEELVTRNKGLVWKIASNFFNQAPHIGLSSDDVVQMGFEGLIKASLSESYKSEKGPFKNYAAKCINTTIVNNFRKRRSAEDNARDVLDIDEDKIAESIPDEDIISPEDLIIFGEIAQNLKEEVDLIKNKKHRRLIHFLYGLDSDDPMKASDFALFLGVKKQAVWEMRDSLFLKLREDPRFKDLWNEYVGLSL